MPGRPEPPDHPFRPLWVAFQRALYARGILNPTKLALPHFLGIGAQKAGTTWLFYNLRRHPELLLRYKELHYFDRPEQWRRLTLRGYARHFLQSGGRRRGEITPDYSALPAGRIRFIRRVMPDVRLFMILRDPVERAWSSAMHRLVKRGGRDPESLSDEEVRSHFHGEGWRLGHYTASLDRWTSIFPAEQLHVCFYDDVVARPRELLAGIFRHLGVSEDVDWDAWPLEGRYNEGPTAPIPARHRDYLAGLYHEELRELARRLGEPVTSWLPRYGL